jgi:hypothetical protein
MLKPAALAVASLWKFLFGSECPRCKGGSFAKRWQRHDGSGSWRMHHTWIGPGHDPLIDYGDDFCERNGWFTRHRLLTVAFAVGFFVIAGIGAAHAADRPDKPSVWFCAAARAARDAAGSERAAEDAARAHGVSEATIQRAKRYSR